jgi:hypothetical protein
MGTRTVAGTPVTVRLSSVLSRARPGHPPRPARTRASGATRSRRSRKVATTPGGPDGIRRPEASQTALLPCRRGWAERFGRSRHTEAEPKGEHDAEAISAHKIDDPESQLFLPIFLRPPLAPDAGIVASAQQSGRFGSNPAVRLPPLFLRSPALPGWKHMRSIIAQRTRLRARRCRNALAAETDTSPYSHNPPLERLFRCSDALPVHCCCSPC